MIYKISVLRPSCMLVTVLRPTTLKKTLTHHINDINRNGRDN